MTTATLRTLLLIVDGIIVFFIAAGFVFLKRYFNAHCDDNSADRQEKIKRIIRATGIIIAVFGFIAAAVGIGAFIL